MRVCLINPTSANNLWGTSFPPLGLAYIASSLRGAGHSVLIIDRNVLLYKNGMDIGAVDRITAKILKEACPDFIGLSATSPIIPDSYRVIKAAKNISPGVVCVLGGVHATILPEETLSECEALDIVVRGEGEQTILDIVSGKELEKISGISYRKDAGLFSNPPASPIADLDSLPFPAYDLLDMKTYTRPSKSLIRGINIKGTAVITSRGCPFRCYFCAGPAAFGQGVRFHSVDYVIDQIKWLIQKYGIEGIYFADDMFLANQKRAREICSRMMADKLHKQIVWCAQLRVDTVNEELLSMMKRAGCVQVEYGFESASQRILDLIDKKTTVEQNYRAAELTRKAGLRFLANIIVGMPGETREDFLKSVEFILAVKPDNIAFYKLIPVPGSKIFYDYQDRLKKIGKWDIFTQDNLELNFTSIPSGEFASMYRRYDHKFRIMNTVNYLRYNLREHSLRTANEMLFLILKRLKKWIIRK